MEVLNNIAAQLGAADVVVLAIWAGTGLVLGLIMIGKRPLGLLGDMILGAAAGVGGGWAFLNFLHPRDINLATLIQENIPLESLTPENAIYIGAAAEAFIGALVILILLRLIIRR